MVELRGLTSFKDNSAKTSGAHLSLAGECDLKTLDATVNFDGASLAAEKLNIMHVTGSATMTAVSATSSLFAPEDSSFTFECTNPPKEGVLLTAYTTTDCTWACDASRGYVSKGDACSKLGIQGLQLKYAGCFKKDANSVKSAPLYARDSPFKCGANGMVVGVQGLADGVCASVAVLPKVFECYVAYGGKMSLAISNMIARQFNVSDALCPSTAPSRGHMACYTLGCNLGFGWVHGVGCVQCGAGTYSDTDDLLACKQCPAGTYNQVSGSSSVQDCLPCPGGTYSNAPGLANITGCASCPEGLHNPNDGGNSIKSCAPCPAGSHSPLSGLAK